MGNRRFADSEWPEFVEEPEWFIPVLCNKPTNRRDVAPEIRVTHQLARLNPWGGKLRDAVVRAQELIEEHLTLHPTHEGLDLLVNWGTMCIYDRAPLVGASRDQLWEAIADHVETSRHRAGIADQRLMEQMAKLLKS